MARATRKDLAVVEETRRENLRLLLAQWGGPTTLAKKLQHSGPSYLVQLQSGNRPITEKTARGFEAALDLPARWMDTQHHAGENADLLAAALAAVEAEILRTKTTPAHPRQLADIYLLVYEQAKQSGMVSLDYVARLVRLISQGEA